MRQRNLAGEVRILCPSGHTVGNKLVLDGADIQNESADYLGFWHVSTMPLDIKRQLTRELVQNWLPANYSRDAL